MTESINNGTIMLADKSILIHIGYHKTASTWLQRLIFKPEYGFDQPFEMPELYNYIVSPNALTFDLHDAEQFIVKCLCAMPSRDLIPVLSYERFVGDPFTGARDAKEIASRLNNSFPEAKVLIVVREQFDLIASLYKTYVQCGGKAKLDEFIHPKSDHANQWFDYRTYCYDNLIRYYVSLFGRENVLVVAYEDIKYDNQGFYDVLCGFMGIKKRTLLPESHAKVNVGLSELGIGLLRRINLVFGMFCIYPLLGVSQNIYWRVARSAIFRMEGAVMRLSSNGRLKQRVKILLSGKFKESNNALQYYVSLDLRKAGYEL